MAQTTTTTPVRCVNVTKFYAGVLALDNVSVDLRAGECVCLVGDNGAGKSTLVKILSGILSPDIGQVLIDGKPVSLNRQAARQHGIEAVYQDLALCDPLGAVANVMLGQEPIRFKLGPLRIIDRAAAREIAIWKIREIGIELDDPAAPVRRLPAVNAK